MLAQLLFLASLGGACWAQCNSNDEFDNGFGCDNGSPWRSGYSVAAAAAAIVVLAMIFFCCCAQRRRQYAIHQNPGVTPPLFGSAPPAYGMPFWTGNMQAQQPAPPYAPPANGANPFGANDLEANTTGGYGYGQENGGVGGMHYPPPPAINQGSRPNEPPSYFNAGKGSESMPQTWNQEGDDVGASGSYAPPAGPPPAHFQGGFREKQ